MVILLADFTLVLLHHDHYFHYASLLIPYVFYSQYPSKRCVPLNFLNPSSHLPNSPWPHDFLTLAPQRAAQQPHGWDEAQDLDVTGGREDHVFQQAGGPCSFRAKFKAATCPGWWFEPLWKILVISQLGWLFPIYGKIKNVPNHQPVSVIAIILWDALYNHQTTSGSTVLTTARTS